MQRIATILMLATGICSPFLMPQPVQAQELAEDNIVRSDVGGFVWTDKYVYVPGEAITLRWTATANGDTTPTTVVVYRQNNQTGEKTYFPLQTTTATDITGRTPEQGFVPFQPNSVAKTIAIGAGGWLLSSYTAPSELGMHTFVVQFRDASGTRILKSAYFKFSIVSGVENLTGNIDSNRTLVNTRAYRLSGIVNVRNNAVLTIEPGTIILGQPGSQPPSVLVVTRNGRIVADGDPADHHDQLTALWSATPRRLGRAHHAGQVSPQRRWWHRLHRRFDRQ